MLLIKGHKTDPDPRAREMTLLFQASILQRKRGHVNPLTSLPLQHRPRAHLLLSGDWPGRGGATAESEALVSGRGRTLRKTHRLVSTVLLLITFHRV